MPTEYTLQLAVRDAYRKYIRATNNIELKAKYVRCAQAYRQYRLATSPEPIEG